MYLEWKTHELAGVWIPRTEPKVRKFTESTGLCRAHRQQRLLEGKCGLQMEVPELSIAVQLWVSPPLLGALLSKML